MLLVMVSVRLEPIGANRKVPGRLALRLPNKAVNPSGG